MNSWLCFALVLVMAAVSMAAPGPEASASPQWGREGGGWGGYGGYGGGYGGYGGGFGGYGGGWGREGGGYGWGR